MGAVCACALTVGTNKGPPTVDNPMAIIVTIAHRFDERARRHVKGLERLMISSRHLSAVPHCHTVNWSMVWHRRSSSLSVVKNANPELRERAHPYPRGSPWHSRYRARLSDADRSQRNVRGCRESTETTASFHRPCSAALSGPRPRGGKPRATTW